MLRIGLPNKGTLSEPAAVMLREAGYRQRSDARDLVLIDPENEVEFFYLRPRDIATYVAEGQVEVGITGRDLLLDGGVSQTMLKGPEAELPAPHYFHDIKGHRRTGLRLKWWQSGATTWRDAALSVPDPETLPATPIEGEVAFRAYDCQSQSKKGASRGIKLVH